MSTSLTPLAILGLGGPWEIIIVLVVVLLLFGGRIPGIARSLGQGIVEFRKGLKSGEEDKKKELEDGSSGASEHKD